MQATFRAGPDLPLSRPAKRFIGLRGPGHLCTGILAALTSLSADDGSDFHKCCLCAGAQAPSPHEAQGKEERTSLTVSG